MLTADPEHKWEKDGSGGYKKQTGVMHVSVRVCASVCVVLVRFIDVDSVTEACGWGVGPVPAQQKEKVRRAGK